MGIHSQKWFRTGPNETHVWDNHPSFLLEMPMILAGFLLTLGGIVGAVYIRFFYGGLLANLYIDVAFLVASLIGLVFAGWRYLVWKNTWYVITTDRVMVKRGVVGREMSKKMHENIIRVDIDVSPFEALISKLTGNDIGDIVVRSADDRAGLFVLENIPDVSEAERHLKQYSGTSENPQAEFGEQQRGTQQSTQRDSRQANGPGETRNRDVQNEGYNDASQTPTNPSPPNSNRDDDDDDDDVYSPSDLA